MDMDFSQQPKKSKPETSNSQPNQPTPKPAKTKKTVPFGVFLLTIILLLGASSGAFYWRDKEAKAQAKKQGDEIAELIKKVQEAANSADEKEEDSEDSALPSEETLDNIAAAIKSGNTAALEGYMASTVRVILAASEGIGDRTPAQAIADLGYLDSATDPWDFALAPAVLADWGSGDYAPYFPESALVGKSANNFVISFTFNGAGKISGIFISANSDLL